MKGYQFITIFPNSNTGQTTPFTIPMATSKVPMDITTTTEDPWSSILPPMINNII